MFSDLFCRHIRPIGGADFNQVGGHEFYLDVLRSSLYIYSSSRWS